MGAILGLLIVLFHGSGMCITYHLIHSTDMGFSLDFAQIATSSTYISVELKGFCFNVNLPERNHSNFLLLKENQCSVIYRPLIVLNILTRDKISLWSLCFQHLITWNFPEVCYKYPAPCSGLITYVCCGSGKGRCLSGTRFDLKIF